VNINLLTYNVLVVRLSEPHTVKYGLCLSMDEKYRGLKRQLSTLCGVPASRLLLVDVYGTQVRVSRCHFVTSTKTRVDKNCNIRRVTVSRCLLTIVVMRCPGQLSLLSLESW